MSAENVELLRRAYKAFNEGDRSVFLEHYDPDILLWVSPSYPESGTVLGAADVERWFAEFFAPFGRSFRVEPEELIEVGDSVVVLTTELAQGRRSGAEVSTRQHTLIYTLRAGKIIRIDIHVGRSDALAAVGVAGVADVAGERGDRAAVVEYGAEAQAVLRDGGFTADQAFLSMWHPVPETGISRGLGWTYVDRLARAAAVRAPSLGRRRAYIKHAPP